MANLLDKTYSLKGMEPSIEAMALVDEMFDTIFAMLRESAIGGENSSSLVLDTSLFSEGDLLYVSDGVGTLSGLAVSTSAGTFLRSDGSLPEWSALTLPNAATTGDLLYANATNAIVALADVATGNALISGGVGVAPSWGKVGLTTHISGTLALANGGTGLSVVASGSIIRSTGTAFVALAPGTSNRFLQGVGSTLVWAASNYALPQTVATGDLVYASSTTVVAVLTIGAAGKVLRSGGTTPAWSTFTIPDTYAQGDLLYASATSVLTALVKNVSATRYLSNTGSSNNPAWAQVDLTNGVTGTLPVANGGTGAATLATDSLLTGNGTGAIQAEANLTFDGTDLLLGSGIRARMASQNRFRYLNAIVQADSTGATTIPTATWTSLALADERIDTDGIHDNVTNNTRLTANLTGKYLICAVSDFTANGTGSRLIRVYKNGTTWALSSPPVPGHASVNSGCDITNILSLTAGDYIELQAYQDSGGNLTNHNSIPTDFGMYYIGE